MHQVYKFVECVDVCLNIVCILLLLQKWQTYLEKYAEPEADPELSEILAKSKIFLKRYENECSVQRLYIRIMCACTCTLYAAN